MSGELLNDKGRKEYTILLSKIFITYHNVYASHFCFDNRTTIEKGEGVMIWLLFELLLFDAIVLLIKFFRAVKKFKIFEQTGEKNDADKEFKQFCFFLILLFVIDAILIVYYIVEKNN